MSQLWCATSPVKILVDIAGWIGNNDVVDSAFRSWWFLFLFQKDLSQVSMASLNTVRFSVDQCRSLYEIQTFRTFCTAVSSLLIFIAPCEVTWFHSFMFEFRIFHVLSIQNWHSTSTPKCQLGNIMFKWRPRPCEEAQLRKMKLQNQETSPWHGGRKALGPWWVSLLVTCQSCTGG